MLDRWIKKRVRLFHLHRQFVLYHLSVLQALGCPCLCFKVKDLKTTPTTPLISTTTPFFPPHRHSVHLTSARETLALKVDKIWWCLREQSSSSSLIYLKISKNTWKQNQSALFLLFYLSRHSKGRTILSYHICYTYVRFCFICSNCLINNYIYCFIVKKTILSLAYIFSFIIKGYLIDIS